MSLAPLPNIPYTPAPAYLWINAPPSSTPTRTVRPNLRLKISVDLLLPAIFAPKAGKRPRGLEEYFEVAVPLGGKVEVSLEVTREGTSLLRGPPPVSEEEGEEEEEEGEDTVWREGHERSCTLAETSLDNHLRLNTNALGLQDVATSYHDTEDELQEESTLSFTQYTLFPSTACPTHSPLTNHLIPAGKPTAYLQAINLSLQWNLPKVKKVKQHPIYRAERPQEISEGEEGEYIPRHIPEEDEDILEDDSDDILEEPVKDFSNDGVLQDDDMLLDEEILPDEKTLLDDDISPNDGILLYDNISPYEDEDILPDLDLYEEDRPDNFLSSGSLPLTKRPQSQHILNTQDDSNQLPEWAIKQIETGLIKFLKTHMMKRFPLIFDGSLVKIVPLMSIPYALAPALSAFLLTSKRHRTELHVDAIDICKTIVGNQDADLSTCLDTLLSLAYPKRKHTSSSSEEEGSLGSKKRKRTRDTSKTPTHQEIIEGYFGDLRQSIVEQSHVKGRIQEGRLRWMLQDTMKAIGRSEWSRRRLGQSNYSLGRLQFSSTPPGHQDQVSISAIPSIDDPLPDLHVPADDDILSDFEVDFDDEFLDDEDFGQIYDSAQDSLQPPIAYHYDYGDEGENQENFDDDILSQGEYLDGDQLLPDSDTYHHHPGSSAVMTQYSMKYDPVHPGYHQDLHVDSLSYVDSAFQNTYNDDDDILHSDEEYIDQDYPDRIGTHHDQNLHFTSAYDFDDILDDPEMWEATYHDSYDDVPDLSSGSNSEGSSLQSSTSDRPSRMVENDFQAEMPYIPIKSDHMNVQDSSVMDADGDMSSMYDVW